MKNYSIHLSSQAQKDLKKLPLKTKQRIIQKIQGLAEFETPSTQQKALVGSDVADFRLRVGDYRILYDLYHEQKIVYILRVGHRREIYR